MTEQQMERVERVAKAICRVYFGDVVVHGDARCCQLGGSDGCCKEALFPVAEAAIKASDEGRTEAELARLGLTSVDLERAERRRSGVFD